MAEAGVEFAKVSYALASGTSDGPDAPEALSGGQAAGRVIVRDVSLSVEAGTVTALLGRSGSGKTTLLRMVNGLVRPTTGTVRVGGVDVGALDAASLVRLRRGMGYCIQETGLFPHMTVERNVGMAMELAGVGKEAVRGRVAEVMGMVGVDAREFGGRYPWQLSGGQRQRVGLARALAAGPRESLGAPAVLLMDEPFGALDPMTRAEMQTMMRELLGRVARTVVLVTHDLDEALYLAGRVVFLESGSVVAQMAAAEVLGSTDAYVRRYVEAVHRAVPDGHSTEHDAGMGAA